MRPQAHCQSPIFNGIQCFGKCTRLCPLCCSYSIKTCYMWRVSCSSRLQYTEIMHRHNITRHMILLSSVHSFVWAWEYNHDMSELAWIYTSCDISCYILGVHMNKRPMFNIVMAARWWFVSKRRGCNWRSFITSIRLSKKITIHNMSAPHKRESQNQRRIAH